MDEKNKSKEIKVKSQGIFKNKYVSLRLSPNGEIKLFNDLTGRFVDDHSPRPVTPNQHVNHQDGPSFQQNTPILHSNHGPQQTNPNFKRSVIVHATRVVIPTFSQNDPNTYNNHLQTYPSNSVRHETYSLNQTHNDQYHHQYPPQYGDYPGAPGSGN